MNPRLKSALLGLAGALAWIYRAVPAGLRDLLITGLFVLESRSGTPEAGLKRLYRLMDRLELAISERAMALGHGEHPKHRLTHYHDFFVDRIAEGSRVLDIGCGYGAVARSIARRVPGSTVMGVDLDEPRLHQAKTADNPANLTFRKADARRDLPDETWDVIVLSNILEHIESRGPFLSDVIGRTRPRKVLIRVPLFERSWHMPMRRELGINYFWFFDVSNGIEEVSERGGDQVDHGDVGGGVSVSACLCPSGLEETVEALHAGVAVA